MDLRTKFDQGCSVNVLHPSSYIQGIKSELSSVSKRKNLLHKPHFAQPWDPVTHSHVGLKAGLHRAHHGCAEQLRAQLLGVFLGLRRRRQLPGTASPSLSSPCLRELELSRHLQAGEATGPKAPEWLLLPPHASPALGAGSWVSAGPAGLVICPAVFKSAVRKPRGC